MHMHGTRPRVFAAQDEFLAAGEEQFALYRVDTVVGGGDGDRLAGQETVGSLKDSSGNAAGWLPRATSRASSALISAGAPWPKPSTRPNQACTCG